MRKAATNKQRNKKQSRKSGVDSPFLSFGGVIDNGSSITPKLTVFLARAATNGEQPTFSSI
jgi:hypothetical protein